MGLSFALALLALALPPAPAALAQAKKADSKRVTFRSYDGVELAGTYYPNPGGKKEAVVLLLHHVDHKKGGNQQQDGWGALAERLQREGYVVLSFDFRGFGDSKTVGPEFWTKQANVLGVRTKRVGKAPPTAIDHKDFNVNYYPNLVHDIAAAKAYLDRRNDEAEVNTSSMIVIGAGEGATLGALWMASECRRYRDKNAALVGPPKLGDPEGRNLAAAVWLSISPSLAGVPVNKYLSRWLFDAGKNSRVPMAFVYGKDDVKGEAIAKAYLKHIKGGPGKGGPLKLTDEKAIKGTSLTGSALLQKALRTDAWIAGSYLEAVMDERGNKERGKRNIDRWRYYYWLPPRAPILAKPPGEDAPSVNFALFMGR
jgi:hypothetical protein